MIELRKCFPWLFNFADFRSQITKLRTFYTVKIPPYLKENDKKNQNIETEISDKQHGRFGPDNLCL